MRHIDLPSPGAISNGLALRMATAKAISAVESRNRLSPTVKPVQVTSLKAFLTAALAKVNAIDALYA